MGLEAPRATGGVEHRVIGGFREVNQGGTWIVKESYNVTSGGVGRLLNLPSHQEPSKQWYQIEAPIGRKRLEIAAVDLRTSRTVSWLPWIKRPLAARSRMSAGSGH